MVSVTLTRAPSSLRVQIRSNEAAARVREADAIAAQLEARARLLAQREEAQAAVELRFVQARH